MLRQCFLSGRVRLIALGVVFAAGVNPTALGAAQNTAAAPVTKGVPVLDGVNTPTAVTLKRGEFNISTLGYDGGGIFNRNILAVHDNIYLGVAFNVSDAIGSGNATLHIPGVVAKVKFTDGWAEFPILLAAGYDGFYTGARSQVQSAAPYNSILYGPYFTITKPIYLLGEEQHVHVGARMPIQPTYMPQETEMYVGIDFPIGMFVPIFEIQHILFDTTRLKETLFNVGLRFQFFDHLALELDFMMSIGQQTNRMIVFEYLDRF